MFIPASQKSHLEDLSKVDPKFLNEEYKRDLKNLVDFVMGKVHAKEVTPGKFMTGPMLKTLIKFLVSSINTESFPGLPSLWNSIT